MQRQLIAAFALVALAAGASHHKVDVAAPTNAPQIVPVVQPEPVQPAFNPAKLPDLPQCEPQQPEPDPLPNAEPEKKPQPKAKPVYRDTLTGVTVDKSAVLMITNGQCKLCTQWWAEHAEKLRAAGWDVREVLGNFPGVDRFPTFRVNVLGRWHTQRGYMRFSRLRELMRYGDVDATQVISSTSWTLNGRPWSRAALIDHLAEHPNHGHSREKLERMTLEQLDTLHTKDHENNR